MEQARSAISASSTARPVRTQRRAATRPSFVGQPSSRRASRARIRGCSCRATIAVIAAKLIWKLGPASASGQSSSTTSAPTATSRRVSASRPSAIPSEHQQRGDAGADRRHLGARSAGCRRSRRARPAPAATSTSRKRSASAGLSASSFRVSSITAPTTAVRWRPLTDSRWARPERRIASASASGIAALVAGGERRGDRRPRAPASRARTWSASRWRASGEPGPPALLAGRRDELDDGRAPCRCRRSPGTRRRGRNRRRRAPPAAPAASASARSRDRRARLERRPAPSPRRH